MDIADLGFRVDSSQAATAATDLDRLTTSAERVDRAATDLGQKFDRGGQGVRRFRDEVIQADDHVQIWRTHLSELRAEFDPLYANSLRYEQRLERLNQAHREGALNAKQYDAALGRLNAEFAGLGAQATAVRSGMFAAAGGIQHVTRNLAYQANQIGQTGAVTGNWIQAMNIQIPDILASFGSLPLVLAGGAIAVAGSLLPSLINAGDAAKDLQGQIEDLAEAIDNLKSANEAVRMSMPDLQERYGMGAERAQRLLDIQRQIAEVESKRSLADVSQTVGGTFDRSALGLLNPFSFATGRSDPISSAAKSLDIAMPKAWDFYAALQRLEQADGPQQVADRLQEAAAVLEDATGGMAGMNDEATALYKSLSEAALKALDVAANIETAEGATEAQTLAARQLLDELRDQAEMQDLIRQYGEDSTEVARARRDAEREVFEQTLETMQITERLKDELRDAWDYMNRMEGVDLPKPFESALSAARSLSGIVQTIGGQLAEMQADQGLMDRFGLGGLRDAGSNLLRNARIQAEIGTDGVPMSRFDRSGVDPSALRALANLERAAGMVFDINSAHRDADHNAAVGGARGSQHVSGRAFDINVRDMDIQERQRLIRQARQAGFGGVGVYDNALHFDTGPERAWGPSYRRDSVPSWAEGALGTKTGGALAQAADDARKAGDAFDGLMASLSDVTAINQRYEASQKTINEALAAGEITAAQAAQAHTLAREQMQGDLAALEESQRAGYDALVASLDPATAAMQELAAAQKAVDEALANGSISAADAARAMSMAQEQYNATIADIQEQALQDNFGELISGIDAVSDAIANAIVNGENLGDALRAVFQQIAADLISSGIRGLLMQTFGLAASGGGGGFLSGLFGGFRASGGPVDPSKGYIVGENGPEWFQPGVAGQIIPNDAISGMSAGPAPATPDLYVPEPSSGGSGVSDQQFDRLVERLAGAMRGIKLEAVVSDERRDVLNRLESPDGRRLLAKIAREEGIGA